MKSKRVLCTLLLVCAMFNPTTFADEDVNNSSTCNNSDIMPLTLYFNFGNLKLDKKSGSISVKVDTYAYSSVDHIYHDITIYKNGILYSYDRYEDWNIDTLNTVLSVPASSGDIIDVEVTHYTSHNGITEKDYSISGMAY